MLWKCRSDAARIYKRGQQVTKLRPTARHAGYIHAPANESAEDPVQPQRLFNRPRQPIRTPSQASQLKLMLFLRFPAGRATKVGVVSGPASRPLSYKIGAVPGLRNCAQLLDTRDAHQ